MEFFDVIKSRRSVRSFLDREISDEVVEMILEAGRLAPSGGNGQNHFFGVIRDRETKARLAQAAGNQLWIASAPVVIALCTDVGQDLAELPDDDFGRIVDQTRFGKDIVAYMDTYPDRKCASVLWNNANTLIPGEHMVLAATNMGMQACWIGYLDIAAASKVLQLPDDMVCLFLLPIGFPAEDPNAVEKKSLDELVFFDKWEERRKDKPFGS